MNLITVPIVKSAASECDWAGVAEGTSYPASAVGGLPRRRSRSRSRVRWGANWFYSLTSKVLPTQGAARRVLSRADRWSARAGGISDTRPRL